MQKKIAIKSPPARQRNLRDIATNPTAIGGKTSIDFKIYEERSESYQRIQYMINNYQTVRTEPYRMYRTVILVHI